MIVKQNSRDHKFTINIKDGYLEGSKYNNASRTAKIKLHTCEPSVTLEEVANAIIDCTFWGRGLEKTVDSNRFSRLDIDLVIQKLPNTIVTYNFNIYNYQSTEDVIRAIASYLTL